MAEKGSMSAAFELTPELRDLLGLRETEYVVKNPVEIVVEATDGSRLKPPQEIRERVVRCRDCEMYDAEDETCCRDPEHTGRGWHANPYGFCAWGFPKNGGE